MGALIDISGCCYVNGRRPERIYCTKLTVLNHFYRVLIVVHVHCVT
jgi:hypothetical protein